MDGDQGEGGAAAEPIRQARHRDAAEGHDHRDADRQGGEQAQPRSRSALRRISLLQLFNDYKGTPHQMAAVALMQEQMEPHLLEIASEWVQCFYYNKEIEEKDYTP